MNKTSFLNFTLLAILMLLVQFNFSTNFQPNSKVIALEMQSSSSYSSTSSAVLHSSLSSKKLSSSSVSKSSPSSKNSSVSSSSKSTSSFSSQSQSPKASSVSQSQNSLSIKISSSNLSSKSSSTSSVQKPSSSSIVSSSSNSSSKSSIVVLPQKENPLPIKITEVGFFRPEEFNKLICGESENNCGKFKWIEIYNPNDEVVNLHDYRIVIGSFSDNSISNEDFLIQPKSFGLIKNYSVSQTTSIVDNYSQVVANGLVKNIDNKSANNISIAIENKFQKVIDSVVINNLSVVAAVNSGKTKFSLFRCSDPNKNQNFAFTTNEPINKILFNNDQGYKFHGTPGREDESCKVAYSNAFGGQSVLITNSPFVPKVPKGKAAPITVDPIKVPVVETIKLPELVKAVIKPTVPVKIPEMVSFPALTTTFAQPIGATIQITNKLTPKIATMEVRIEPLKIEFKDVVSEANVNIKKLAELYKQITPVSVNENLKSKVLSPTNTFIPLSAVEAYNSSKQLQARQILQPFQSSKTVTPILNTKKVTLTENKYTSEPTKIIEIDYQPAQAQWNFLSLVAIAYLFTNIYKKLKEVARPYTNGLIG